MAWIFGLIDQLVTWLVAAMGAWGYAIVFIATILENLFIIGSLTPGELLTAAGGFTASRVPDQLNVWVVWGLAIAGTLIGSNLSYLLGRKGGRQIIERFEGRFGITAESIVAAEKYFSDHGNKTIFFARFVAVFKNFVPVLAGASRMDIWVFQIYTLAGALVYSSLMVGIGFFLGRNFQAGLQVVSALGWIAFAIAVVAIAGVWYLRRRLARAEQDKELAEAVSEGCEPTDTSAAFERLEESLHPGEADDDESGPRP